MASTGSITLARKGLAAIETLRTLNGRLPDEAQRAVLADWPGWGPLAPAFDPEPEGTWETINERLTDLLSLEEMTSAAGCVDNAFYTPPLVIDTVYGLLRAAGFDGGRVLEPGCGSGRFIERAPADWETRFTGVERDLISARIAAALHPQATIIAERFEKAAVPGGFDAVVGNVPFSSARVHDPGLGVADNLHSYFIRRSLSLLRDGGYLVAVTSRYTLDSRENILAKIGDQADFVGALRLPSKTFAADGTEVVADIVVLRKNTSRRRAGWQRERFVPEDGRTETDLYSCFAPPLPSRDPYGGGRYGYAPSRSLPVDEYANPPAKALNYWQDHPEHVAGTMGPGTNRFHPLSVAADDIASAVQTAAAALASQVAALPMFDDETVSVEFMETVDADGRKEGSFHLVGDIMHRVVDGRLTAMARPSKELAALVRLRDLTVALLEAEADADAPDSSMADLRAETLACYRSYVAAYGPLNRGVLHEGRVDEETGMPALTWKRPTLGGFRGDPDFVLVMAVEKFDQDTGDASPAPILLGRVNAAPVPVTSADSPQEALAVSLGECGRVDLDRIADLLGLPDPATAVDALGDLVFTDPDDGRVVPARDYLSGNVRAKIARARAAARTDGRFERNVAALVEVAPADLGPGEIRMNLGNPCLSVADVDDFIAQVLAGSARVEHCPVTQAWKVDGHKKSSETTLTYGIAEMDAYKLVECALNGKSPVVYSETYQRGKTVRVRLPEQTLVAQEKLNLLAERFATWVWEDPDRSDRLCAEYNRRFNSYVPRRNDGSYLTFPGMSTVFAPHPWQRNMVDMALSGPAVLCGHAVGAGKTLTMALTAFSLRRFGLARKPLIVVPNHLLEQIAREMQQAFPLGRYLIATKEDLAKDARRLFAARCATGNWDAVVMTHQAFTSLPVHPRTEQDWIAAQKAEYDDHLRAGTGGYNSSKEIARKLRSLEAQLDKARANAVTDPDQVLFEHLGIDYIMVDEAHMMKRLLVKSRAESFSMGASKRASDLLLKAETLGVRRPGLPRLALFTGTPWTNTLAETFVWQRFLQPQVLKEAQVANFDAWAAVFVKRETVVEVAPDGSGFRIATRPTRMTNLPELKTMLGQVADVLTADDIDLPRPTRHLRNMPVPRTETTARFVRHLVERAERLRSKTPPPGGPAEFGTPANDNMLVICGEGRRVALDPRLVGIDEDSPKVAEAARQVAAVYRRTRLTAYPGSETPGAFQIAFCDQGTPSTEVGPQTYGRLRDTLIEEGVPANRVRMIHEAKDDKSRAALFAACRDGSVSVLIGSTDKVGMGTNVQSRLIAVHHVDAPWRPSDIEQREGRAFRPGNLNPEVTVYRYVTEGTFDAFMWQTLERKALGFAVMYGHTSAAREVDDIGEVVPDYTEMVALATGNPLVAERAVLVATVKRLRTVRAIEGQSVVGLRKKLVRMEQDLDRAKRRLGVLDGFTLAEAREGEGWRVPAAVVAAARHALKNAYGDHVTSTRTAWRGLQVSVQASEGSTALVLDHDYREIDRMTVRRAAVLFKGSQRKASALVADLLDQWQRDLPGRVADLKADVVALTLQIGQAQVSVNQYRFNRQADLDAAAARLAEIEAEMAEHAEEQAKTARQAAGVDTEAAA